jgi:hypothetical protein
MGRGEPKQRTRAYGGPLHRIAKAKGARRVILAPDHTAAAEARTLFPSTVVHPTVSPRLLISGMNQRKIGRMVTKGRWRGMPIYTLTLEERATCPPSCRQWLSCYGNHMPFARRHMGGAEFERRLTREIYALADEHPRGFVVRLHILGDFYSPAYARLWGELLDRVPQLRVFGYTAHAPDSEIGATLLTITQRPDERCWLRFSGEDAGGLGALVIAEKSEARHVVCPAQIDKTDCCGTCGLCWTMDRTIEFIRH